MMVNDKSFFYFCYTQNKIYVKNGQYHSSVEHFYPIRGF